MRRKTIILLLSVVITATLLTGCLKVAHKPTPKNFKMPEVTLNYVDVAHYWGWWYYKKTVKPTMGTAGDYGAPLDLAFIFDVTNPNSFPVLLEELKFTAAFEEFDLIHRTMCTPSGFPRGKPTRFGCTPCSTEGSLY